MLYVYIYLRKRTELSRLHLKSKLGPLGETHGSQVFQIHSRSMIYSSSANRLKYIQTAPETAKTEIETATKTIGNGDKRKRVLVAYTHTWSVLVFMLLVRLMICFLNTKQFSSQCLVIDWNKFKQGSKLAKTIIQTATETIQNGDKIKEAYTVMEPYTPSKSMGICVACAHDMHDDMFIGIENVRLITIYKYC